MANKTFAQFPPASTLYADDIIPIQQLGVVTRHISASQLGITPVATILALTSAASANAVTQANELAIAAYVPLPTGSNVSFGQSALDHITDGGNNVAIGRDALAAATEAGSNVAVGDQALQTISIGLNNVAVGAWALNAVDNANGNIAIGMNSQMTNASGQYNVGVGQQTLQSNTTGSGNVAIGYRAGMAETGSNKLWIANSNGTSAEALIYGDFITGELLTQNKRIATQEYVTAATSGFGGVTLAQVAAASGNALTQANAFTTTASGNLAVSIGAKIDSSALTPYALVTSVQTTAGNLVAQIATKADSSTLSTYALTTVAAAMSANSLAQSRAFTTTASGNIMAYVVALPVGATLAQVASASGNALTQANAFTTTASGNLSTAIAGKIDSSALTLYALVTSVQTTAGNLVGQINAKADTTALANYLPLAGGTTTGNISISAANPKLSVMHPGGFTGSMQVSGGKLIVGRDSSTHKIVIDGVMGSLDGSWFLNGTQVAAITDVWTAESNANAYTNAASANIMTYVAGIGGVTPAYVQAASANAYVQSSAFTTSASGNIMAYVGQITANPPGDYVNLSTTQSISGIKTFFDQPYLQTAWMPSAEPIVAWRTISGAQYLDLPGLISPSERVINAGSMSVSGDFDLSLANFFTMTLTAPLTAGFINGPGSISPRAITITVIVSQTGDSSISWRDVQWAGGTAPTLTPSGKDMLNFLTYDGGTSYIGTLSLKDIK